MRFILPLIAFLVLAVVLGLGLQRDPRALPSALLDRPAPQINLPLLDEPQVNFDSTKLLGKVWLFNVWASWCGPCREELPALKVLASRDNVPLYGLNYKDDAEQARALLRSVGNPYLGSAVDTKGRVGMDYGVQGVPETFVIDAAGRIRYRHAGPITADVWRDRLMPVIRSLQ